VIKLLVVDDSPLLRRLLGRIFAAEGDFEVAFARDGLEALAQLTTFEPDVITLDVNMPGMDGIACLDRIMIERPCPVVMVSSLTEAGADVTLEALDLGAVDFIAKPKRALSLEIDALAPALVEKVRTAAKARLRRTHRLAERVRLRSSPTAGHPPPPQRTGAPGRAGPGPRASDREAASRHHTRLGRCDVSSGTDTGGQALARDPSGTSRGLVLVGTSTGGPPALDALLSRLPGHFPWPIVVAQHMPAAFTGPLARRLDKLCALTVCEVVEPMPLLPGNVYIGRGDADVIIGRRASGPTVMAAPALPELRWHPSVDRLTASAMDHLDPSRLVGVLMTGMGNDGARTMGELRRRGGQTIAEAEETAVVWGMPGELVKAGGADVVVPLDRIAGRLIDLVASA
jgi:two-component system chemotaxis response regulator CheB